MTELANGKLATAECHKVDRYGRDVCTVWIRDVDVGLAQVRAGLAWHYKQYASEQPTKRREEYDSAEQTARRERLGLWLQGEPTPPWEWRHRPSPAARPGNAPPP
jgi:endonuclease YncB( thermonuclease family)